MIRIHSLYVILIFSSLTTPVLSETITLYNEKNVLHAQEWTRSLTQTLEPEKMQLAANILYLLYANALIDIKIRQFIIPITRLNQTVRSNIANYKNTTKELATLKTLLDRLSHVIGARTIYNQILKTCLDYYNNNQSEHLTQSIVELQIYGQNTLNEFAELNQPETAALLKSSSELLMAGVQPLQDISKIYTGIADGSVTELFKNNEETRQFAALITLDELLRNSTAAIQNTEHILNTLDASTESILQLISSATDIYKQHYEALYKHISSADDFDQLYACTLFGMNDVLSDEYKSPLPHPDNVFEHVLQTIKLYTQIELIQ